MQTINFLNFGAIAYAVATTEYPAKNSNSNRIIMAFIGVIGKSEYSFVATFPVMTINLPTSKIPHPARKGKIIAPMYLNVVFTAFPAPSPDGLSAP